MGGAVSNPAVVLSAETTNYINNLPDDNILKKYLFEVTKRGLENLTDELVRDSYNYLNGMSSDDLTTHNLIQLRDSLRTESTRRNIQVNY